MRNLTLLICLVLLGQSAFSQTTIHNWASKVGNASSENIPVMTTDAFDNTFMAGHRGSLFNPPNSIVVSKFDQLGSLAWVKTFNATVNQRITSMATDASGNVYVVGYFTGTMDFDPGPSTYNITTASGFPTPTTNGFLLKLDPQGNFLWAGNMTTFPTQWDGAYSDIVDVKLDSQGNIYLLSTASGNVDLVPGPGTILINGGSTTGGANFSYDWVVTKLDSNGVFKFYRSGETTSGTVVEYDMRITSNDDVMLVASTSDDSDFWNLPTFLESMAVIKLSKTGGIVWHKQMGGLGSLYHKGIELDQNDNLYITGYYYNTITLSAPPSPVTLTSMNGSYDPIIMKLDTAGNLVWVYDISGPDNYEGYNIQPLCNGHVIINGRMDGPIDMEAGPGSTNLSAGSYPRSFMLEIDDSAGFVHAQVLPYFPGAMNMGASCDLYIGGTFKHVVDFDFGAGVDVLSPYSSVPNPASYNSDLFVHKMNVCPSDPVTIDTVFACSPYQWIDGQSYSASNNSATVTYSDQDGCDSIVLLDLTILSNQIDTFVNACDSFTWRGNTYYQAGVYPDSLVNQFGCDSVINLNLDFPLAGQHLLHIGCDSFLWKGTTFYNSGIYIDTVILPPNGCVIYDTLDLTLDYSLIDTVVVASCDSFSWYGNTYYSSGFYTYSGIGTNGCDFMSILDLSIVPSSSIVHDTVFSCVSYNWGSDTLLFSGDYVQSFSNQYGCDSTVELYLTILNPSTGDTTAYACDSFYWHGGTYFSSGQYVDTLINQDGCDSLLTLNLHLGNSVEVDTACNFFFWGGQLLTSSGIYYDTLSNPYGCDSILQLNLVINSTTYSQANISACDSFTWQGSTYFQSGVYQDTLTNAAGCDSILTLALNIETPVFSDTTVVACDQFVWWGITYSQSGQYADTATTIAGCMDIRTLHLTVKQSTTGDTAATSCGPFTWQGATYSQSGEYTHTFTNSTGCDSIVKLTLTVNGVDDLTTMLEGHTIAANAMNASFQWLDCDSGYVAISGATDRTFTPTQNGNYAVEITQNGCVDTTACVNVTTVGISDALAARISVYPNPSDGQFTLDLGGVEASDLEIYDLAGKHLMDLESVDRQVIQLEVSQGVYLLQMTIQGARHQVRLMIR
ncbi:T9SS type A sorting domain-containing protein [Pontibacter sp. G13]|uniref:T9SS type A sorting domain-containing protein n=1 Tax=Pontibacter sp. G13 TaxID=3074898 RepID=UPI00288A209F|nr:T9SS type A sorting domain-containing protein [Pontibacter sp. G13]WNJ18316.1 T9SS type A sorting domain-containing protein [Pontibacter sp. G13]